MSADVISELKEKLRGIYEGLGKISEIKLLEGF